MAAYAALVSLMNTITLEQRPRYHLYRRISIDGGLLQALQERASSLVEFLEKSGWKGVAKHLEDRIADAAYAAEDVIESHVVDQVLSRGDTSTSDNRSALLREDLSKIMRDMDSIKNELVLIKEEHRGSSRSAGLSSAPSLGEKIKMVGFEDEKMQVMEKLTGGDSGRIVIPIIGMGGSGKTTLSRNIFDDERVVHHFDVRAWVTISQEYNVNGILLQLLSDQNNNVTDEMGYEALTLKVHQHLCGRRYLVILDDIWSIDVLYVIQNFFPNDHNGSRILITTRDSTLASKVSTSWVHMKCLDEDKSWILLCEKVFGQNNICPPEFEVVGKMISRNCKGLPLIIVVLGGLLAKSRQMEYWDHVAELSIYAIHLDEDDHCLKILSLSYNYLPVHLKPCFLYMGVFPEDHAISVPRLINLWIAEGFLKPIKGKNLEEIAKECLADLIARNLIMVCDWGSSGEIEYCSIHDLLRELCLREAQREKFICVVPLHGRRDLPSMNGQRRIAILPNKLKTEEYSQIMESLLSTSNPRSLIAYNYKELSRVLGSPIFKLLRVFCVMEDYHERDAAEHECLSRVLFDLINLRYLSCEADEKFMHMLASSIGILGNLQILAVKNYMCPEMGLYEIWNLPQLRHVEFHINSLPEPPFGEQEQHDCIVLQYLQTLQKLFNFRFEERILVKIPNIKQLHVCYDSKFLENKEWSHYSFCNLARFEKLESFECSFFPSVRDCNDLLQNLAFPLSLKKLSLCGCGLPWKDMTVISLLPLLEVLELKEDSFIGPEWNLEEGGFPCLKYLCMCGVNDLIHWKAENIHFPRLKNLVLTCLQTLKEIPSEIGDIATLSLIELDHCADSIVSSAKRIMEEQQDLGNDELLAKVTLAMDSKLPLSSLEIKNFLVDAKDVKHYMEDSMQSLDLPEDIDDDFDVLNEFMDLEIKDEINKAESSASELELDPLGELEYVDHEVMTQISAVMAVHKLGTKERARARSKANMAEAAVEFLLGNLKQLLLYHTELIKRAKGQVEKLERDICFFRDFLSDSSKKRHKDDRFIELICYILDVVYEAEDTIGRFVTGAIEPKTQRYFDTTFKAPLSLNGIARKVESIKHEVKKIFRDGAPEKPEAPLVRKENVVGFEDEAATIIGYLREKKQQLDVISIVGMPGLGKTTLAMKIFNDKAIQYEFPTRIWVYVSEEFTRKDVYLTILYRLTNNNFIEDLHQKSDEQLAKMLSMLLKKGKFLLVMDDVWTTKDWEDIQVALPKNNGAGKVLITSRYWEVANHANQHRAPHALRLLTHEESWVLLKYKVFGKLECPPELEVPGKVIVEQCDGLPLAIVVVGGTLCKKISTSDNIRVKKDAWEKVSIRMGSFLPEDLQRRTEMIIALSYDELSYDLRACFLYLGMFPKTFEIPVWRLIRMWSAEGFIERKEGMNLEEIAENYLDELVNRNLVRVGKRKQDGKVKTCRIHDMLHDFCKTEAETDNFFQEIKRTSLGFLYQDATVRRICIHSNVVSFLSSKPLGPRARSFVCFSKENTHLPLEDTSTIPKAFKLLRVLDVKPIEFQRIPKDMFQLLHLRYIVLSCNTRILPAAFAELWNIETFVVDTSSRTLEIKADIWKMSLLRHLKTNASAALPPVRKSSKGGEMLQTLGTISPQSCTEKVFDRARNLKKLGIRGQLALLLDGKVAASFNNLVKLSRLEKLKLLNDVFPNPVSEGKLHGLPSAHQFPPKLKSLTLSGTLLDWHYMSVLGLLENMQVLKLKDKAFMGKIWEAKDGGFRSLEVLHIGRTDLSIWLASDHHYPRLRCLELYNCEELTNVPIGLAEIPNFQILDLYRSKKAATSANRILEFKQLKWEEQNIKDGGFRLSIFPRP